LRLDLESGHIVEILEPSADHLYTFSFSTDGQYLAYILRRYDPMLLNIVDLKTGEYVNYDILNKSNQAGNILWSPDQRRIVFGQAIVDYYDQHLFSVIAINLAAGSRQVLVLDNPVKMKPDIWIDNNKLELSCEDGIRRIFDFENNLLYEK
jgi:Tol biopolymer transport system component